MGFDISEKIVSAVNDGTILGTVAQDPYRIGYATVVAAARSVLELENAEKIQTAPFKLNIEKTLLVLKNNIKANEAFFHSGFQRILWSSWMCR